jgi:spore maturation protein CgeB
MKILVLNSDTDEFLRWFYQSTPGLEKASYAEQLRARHDTLYGMSDFYSRNFNALGHEAREIFTNNIWLQTAWAREHGVASPTVATSILREDSDLIAWIKRVLHPHKSRLAPIGRWLGLVRTVPDFAKAILLAQVEEMRPDIIINQSLSAIGAETMRLLRANGRTLVIQQGVALPEGVDLSPYDFGVSMLPWVVERFQQQGLHGEQVHLAFEPGLLDRLGPAPSKEFAVSFVGNIASGHGTRIRLLEEIARRFPIALWLPNLKGLSANSPLRKYHKGQVWGREMYDILRRSRIVWNSHIDDARNVAGNLRLFEATGVGSFLMTDSKSNLATLFQPGEEVAAYESADDCLRKIEYFLARDDERERVAHQGQARTLGHHTYRHRVEQILGLVARYGR